jgi:hypothetical protein
VKQLEQSKTVADPRVAALQDEVRSLQEQLQNAKSAHEAEVAKLKTLGNSSSSPGGKEVMALKKQIETLVRARSGSSWMSHMFFFFFAGGRKGCLVRNDCKTEGWRRLRSG